jgi:peptidoglycan/xylan/chitin deacetylase (PgdA/CDA1 family)
MSARLLASVSLDLDNQWSYMKTHGDPGWESFPSYLDALVPHALEALDALGLRITFFVVGQDAVLAHNHAALEMIAPQGHEIGNHSFHHEQWMNRHGRDEIDAEISRATAAITAATGQRPRGFRGPGFSWNKHLLEVLADAGYLYDASTFPTFLGPLARRYYLRQTSMTDDERRQRSDLFGDWREGFRPVKPYLWELDRGRRLLEIPVTTMPIVRSPFHLSYLLYLSRYSTRLMLAYLQAALRLCRLTGTEPSFLLHPLDLLDGSQAPALRFFPGMDLPGSHKMAVFRRVLEELRRQFTLVTVGDHAKQALGRELPLRNPHPGSREVRR